MSNQPKSIARLLQAEQARRRLSDQKIAKYLNMTTSRYIALKRGLILPNIQTLERISEFLKMGMPSLEKRRSLSSYERAIERNTISNRFDKINAASYLDIEISFSIERLIQIKVGVSPLIAIYGTLSDMCLHVNEQLQRSGIEGVFFNSNHNDLVGLQEKLRSPHIPNAYFMIIRKSDLSNNRLLSDEKIIIRSIAYPCLWHGYFIKMHVFTDNIVLELFDKIQITPRKRNGLIERYIIEMHTRQINNAITRHLGFSICALICK